MRLRELPDAARAAQWAAAFLARRARAAIRTRGRCLLALSGGTTPAPMFAAFARRRVAWERVELFQVDERIARRGSAARNWTVIERTLCRNEDTAALRAHPMPVERADLARAARAYAELLTARAGLPPQLDVVHLGLGSDGHTASLFDDERADAVDDAWVTVTATQRGYRRMTVTFRLLAHARCVLWLVCGQDKAETLARLVAGDETIPAGRVPRAHAYIVADAAAASALPPRLRAPR